ncbi:MAG: hypothetical protein U9P07_12470 [Pseudomonadota bacterium]|nr:hypothetical protein [Pseudomonadota bacterium]
MFGHGSRSFSPAVHGRLWGALKQCTKGVRRESQWGTVLKTVPNQVANTACLSADRL